MSSLRLDGPAWLPSSIRVVRALGCALVLLFAGESATHAAPPEVSCAELEDCKNFGKCTTLPDGRCSAAADDCLQSVVCSLYGSCEARDGGCFEPATAESDCFVPRGAYLYEPCIDGGRCEFVGGTCRHLAYRDSDCDTPRWGFARSACEDFGMCKPVDGACRATHASHCEQSVICRENGRCGLVDGLCVASSDAACKASEACAMDGLCRAYRGVCVATLEDCLLLSECAADDLDCRIAGGYLLGACAWPSGEFEF